MRILKAPPRKIPTAGLHFCCRKGNTQNYFLILMIISFFVRINDLFKLYIIVGETALACFCRADVYRIACYVTAVALFLDNFIGLTNILNPPIYGSNFIVV